MILAIDLGNTNVTIGCLDEIDGRIFFEERIHTDIQNTSSYVLTRTVGAMETTTEL